MRPLVRGLLILGACALCVAMAARPLALWAAKKQLRAVFPRAQVSIAGCQLNPFSYIRFQGVRIAHERVFECAIKQARIDFDRDLLTRFSLKEIALQGVSLKVSQAGKSLVKLADEIRLAPGKNTLSIQSFRLSEFHCAIKSKELNCDGDFSLTAHIPSQKIVSFDGVVSALDGFGVYVENASMVIPAAQASGENFFISLVKVGKVRLTEIKGALTQQDKMLVISPLSCKLFGGRLKAEATLRFAQGSSYEARIEVQDLDLEKLTAQLEFKEKVELAGLLAGKITVSGSGSDLKALSGDMLSGLEGGMVKIKDAQLLKGAAGGVAGSAGVQGSLSIDPLDIVVENLKDYHYNTGSVKLGLEEKNIVVHAHLDSNAQGKRDFAIVLHRAQ